MDKLAVGDQKGATNFTHDPSDVYTTHLHLRTSTCLDLYTSTPLHVLHPFLHKHTHRIVCVIAKWLAAHIAGALVEA